MFLLLKLVVTGNIQHDKTPKLPLKFPSQTRFFWIQPALPREWESQGKFLKAITEGVQF